MIVLRAQEKPWLAKRSNVVQRSQAGRDSRVEAVHASIEIGVYLVAHRGILTPPLNYGCISGITVIILKLKGSAASLEITARSPKRIHQDGDILPK